tara:strand:+ start:812 stop:1216 length:405 start_codon:yes stop_codon:yes gene_type:complete
MINSKEVKPLFIGHVEAVKMHQLGFNRPCVAWYVDSKTIRVGIAKASDPVKRIVEAPTWDQAFEWLQTKYKLHGYFRKNFQDELSLSEQIWEYIIPYTSIKLSKEDSLINRDAPFRNVARQHLLQELISKAEKS